MDPYIMLEVVEAYNKNPQKYTDQEAEFIATIAKALGKDFERENQPVKKGLYNLLETVTLGFAPDELKPVSRGETVYGETEADQIGGGLGTLLGFGTGLGGAYLGGRALLSSGVRRAARGRVANASSRLSQALDRSLGIPGISNVGITI